MSIVSKLSIAEEAIGGAGKQPEQFTLAADSSTFSYSFQDVATDKKKLKRYWSV